MPNEETKRFKIKLGNEEEQEFSVSFIDAEESLEMIEDLHRVKGAFEKRGAILKIRRICQTKDNHLFFPDDKTNLPKARWVSVSAAASYPRGIPVNEIVARTDLTPEKVSAYCTSKNNPTSKYLYKGDGAVFINPEGIDWLFGLLKKDKQIDEDEDRNEENSLSES